MKFYESLPKEETHEGEVLIFRYTRKDPRTGKIIRSSRPMPMWVKR